MNVKTMYQTIKLSLFSLILLATITSASAQHRGGGTSPAFDKGSKTLAFSLGVGEGENGYDYYGNPHNSLPAFAVTYDQGIFANVGPGTIGIGGIIAGKTAYDNDNDHKNTWSSFLIGVRGDYHLTILKDRNNKFDPYAGITIGARFNNFHSTDGNYNTNSSNPIVAPFIGAKYNFRPSIGVFAELAADISLLRGGININF